MPGSYTILPAARFVYTRGWGVVTDEQLHAHAIALRADPRFQPAFAQLADLRDVSDIQITSAGIRTMPLLNPFGKGARRAFVTPNTTAFGLARMYELMKQDDDDQLMVVREISDALKWLGERAPAGWQQIPPLEADWTSAEG